MSGCGKDADDIQRVAPGITAQPVNQTVTVGQTATFSVTATGTAPTYQWYKGTTAVSGATSSSYTTPATAIADSGSTFKVTIINAIGSVTSSGATLTVNDTTPLATSLVPSSATPPYHSPVNLVPTFSGGTAVVGSAGIGSSDITAAASSGTSYATPALTSATTYTLTVTSPGGVVASTTVVVTPTSVTISAISPAGSILGPGQVSFSATASGGATNNLTWSAGGGSFTGTTWTSPNAAGAYTITATSVDEPSVSVSTSATVSAPVVTTQPASQSVCSGGTAMLSVAASYATSYQWLQNGSAISGATNSSYNIPAAASGDAGSYSATVTNPAGSVMSSVAQVLVGSSITANPKSLSIFDSQTATFSVAASGQAPFTYQWYLNSGSVPSATASTYTTPPVDASYNGAQYHASVTDRCGTTLTSSAASLTVVAGNVPPTITTEPASQAVTAGNPATYSVTASGTPGLTYQWYVVPAGQTSGTIVGGATSAAYTVPGSNTATPNDQDAYYVIVSNAYGQAVSQKAPLVVGNGILVQITGQPATQYVNPGNSATFSVAASSALSLSYQWYEAAPGSSTFSAIPGATNPTYTLAGAADSDSGSVFYVVVSNGSTSPVTSSSASLFVGSLAGINGLCDTNWSALGNAFAVSGCGFQLTAATFSQYGEIVWPTLVSTGNLQLSFTIAVSNPSTPPADGFAMVLGDPSLGATPTSTGMVGSGLGAEGIPGFVLGFDTYENAGDPPVPYLGVGRGEPALWENPWFNVNTNIPPLASPGSTISHDYTVSIVQEQMTVTMDGSQVFSGNVTVPPVAYLYVTASTGGSWEQTNISNLSATVSAPSN